ncbi:MAG: preprotein translocase subunit SecF [Actinobacteria bacterium ADurb.Bin444]|nr:MAG: preprotein translocase subunit SecF [Actinobacteria bacterium ADurb.Bin444]
MKIYPFMRYKYWLIGLLGAVTAFALIAIFVVGLHLGIEFKGGVKAEVRLTEASTSLEVREAFTAAGIQEPIVQSVGNDTFVITAPEMSDEQFKQGIQNLSALGAQEATAGLERIGPSFGKETANRAMLAVGISILFMIGYIGWRFDFKFALPAIASLVHDVALMLGIYAIAGRLVTTATVAATLTILGYSINDTIIVFDRIRENQGFMKTETYGDMVDKSIRQVIVRSINTSVTTLVPLLAILLFGGETLKDFALALFIGITSGTYSSIFVAAPLLVLWKEREPKYRRRLAAAKGA